MKSCREEVSNLFEPHIISITRKIDEQLNWMQANGIERPIVSHRPPHTRPQLVPLLTMYTHNRSAT